MIRISLIVIFIAITLPARAQERGGKLVFQPGTTLPEGAKPDAAASALKLDESIRKTIDTFFAGLQKKQVEQAYDQLVKGTKIAEKPEEVATLKSKTQQALELFGDIKGYDLISTQMVGARLLNATYLSLGSNYPLRWRFYFYRPADSWRLLDIRVDDRLGDMFGEPPQKSEWPR